jgi:hypothetical protein
MSDISLVQELADREAIHQLVVRYALAVDSRDIDTLVSLYDDEASAGRYGQGPTGMEAFFRTALKGFRTSVHFVGNHVVDFTAADRATGVVYCSAEHEMVDPPHWLNLTFQYWDDYVKRTNGRWYFRDRAVKAWYTQTTDRATGAGAARAKAGAGGAARGNQLPEAFPTWAGLWQA